jgi:hypothetical protein
MRISFVVVVELSQPAMQQTVATNIIAVSHLSIIESIKEMPVAQV